MMVQQQTVSTGSNPAVVITQSDGDIRLMGWERQEVLVKAEDAKLSKDDDNGINMHCHGDAVVRIPEGASLQIDTANGDTRIKSVNGEVRIGNVNGDLAVRHTGAVDIEHASGDASVKHVAGRVHIGNVNGDLSVLDTQGLNLDTVSGDLSARAIRGAVEIDEISGDMTIEAVQGVVSVDHVNGDVRIVAVQGTVSVSHVGGDADISAVQGSVNAAHVGGDLHVQAPTSVNASTDGDATVSFISGIAPSNITAQGDISCRFTPDTNATVTITSGSSSISLDVPGAERSIEESSYTLTLGAGGTPIVLNASGDVSITSHFPADKTSGHKEHGEFNFDFDFDFDNKAQQMAGQWAGFGEQIAQRARAAAERATAKAQAKVEQAARRAERHVGSFGRRGGAWWKSEPMQRPDASQRPRPPQPPAPPSAPVSDEERVAILRMLQQKKITAEQADQLLAALSGK